ncbi:alpha/beta hydrolase family protein [Commensalibacter papalotli (ex Servin-Garciduenas et al. 2014)]|uniref:Peptidase S9 prolyl oligopeptidase active site domain-containing protein n=1 Tax=Commensalibacter papalotli (ex Servin-Garciduenas et al. 2014) TaxID=1208583 RepID=W7DKT7_9PROT|nr:prolyl oligopeptidase family serine peptidase [Commensalibacter papalotli (ex Servin-Garciduenas et al. 2014)]EUK17952.1 peptidase S9 prolyl oligopeptidase active site domain-containing protein [Commensalibacter papalotli (ex Servin-Garciduenas et al. 2014)]
MTDLKTPSLCGSWISSFTPQIVNGKNIIFSELTRDHHDIYWLERRPAEQGRTVLVKWNKQEGIKDITLSPFSVGSQVHEYGGGAYHVHNHQIVFSDQKTGSVWFIDNKQEPVLIFQNDQYRFADFQIKGQYILCVAERHQQKQVKNSLVALSISTPQQITIITEGADFYSFPRLSPDQQHLAWIEWDHPHMPWEATRLCIAHINQASHLENKRIVAGIDQEESLIQPGWTSDNQLIVCSDRNNYWNLYQVDRINLQLTPIAPMEAEIGLPAWVFGQQSWYFIQNNHFIAQKITNGCAETILINNNKITPIDLDYPNTCPVPLQDQNSFAWINNSPYRPAQIMMQDSAGKQHILAQATSIKFDQKDISYGQPICFSTQDRQKAHAFFYPPTNKDYCSIQGELPPLLVLAHGGPTGQTTNAFSPRIQFWTSRGFSVIDVNYRGSTGFGKEYRNALQKNWGILDVQDCIDACQYLIDRGKVDPKRIVIRGSSAGGFTVLTALIQSQLFAAGSCLYGVGDLTAMAEDTHKFEARYLDGLIGKYPEEKHIYKERSPLNHIHNIKSPSIIFQGLKDKVVPPSQAEAIINALKENHIPYAYYTFPEEGHGFRQEETLTKVLEMELSFFGKILGFIPANLNEEVSIYRKS